MGLILLLINRPGVSFEVEPRAGLPARPSLNVYIHFEITISDNIVCLESVSKIDCHFGQLESANSFVSGNLLFSTINIFACGNKFDFCSAC